MKLITAILLSIIFFSCNNKSDHCWRTDLECILNKCKGNAVVVGEAIRSGYSSNFRHCVVIKDDSLNVWEYCGPSWGWEIGDTLK